MVILHEHDDVEFSGFCGSSGIVRHRTIWGVAEWINIKKTICMLSSARIGKMYYNILEA